MPLCNHLGSKGKLMPNKDTRFTRSDTPIDLTVSGARYAADSNGTYHEGFEDTDLDMMVLHWQDAGRPKLPIELGEHGGKELAGYICEVWTERRGANLVLKALCEWNQVAASAIDVGTLTGISVEAWLDSTDKRSGKKQNGWSLKAAALCARPYYDVNDMQPVMLTDNIDGANKCATLFVALSNKGALEARKMKELLKLLGLSDSASEADAIAKVTALQGELEQKKQLADGVQSNVKLLADYKAEIEPKVALLSEQVKTLGDQLKDATAKVESAEAEKKQRLLSDFIDRGQKAGKIGTKKDDKGVNSHVEMWSKMWSVDPDGAEKMLSDSPVIAPVGQLTGLTATDPDTQVTAEDLATHRAAVKLQEEKHIGYSEALTLAQNHKEKK